MRTRLWAWGSVGLLGFTLCAVAPARPPQSAGPDAEALFTHLIPPDQLTFLNQYVGESSGDAIRDKRYRSTVEAQVPQTSFHFGVDMPLYQALQLTLNGSRQRVRLENGRYLMMSGSGRGNGFTWVDLQSGVVLSGIFFHPSNGEPTPTLTIFSRQVMQDAVKMSQLPAAFQADLSRWLQTSNLPLVTPRYFIGGLNVKILLEHDEDYCAPVDGSTPPSNCDQRNADAADIDLNTAYYLEQTHFATNATARMIEGSEEVDWIALRERTCHDDRDVLACRIRLTHDQIHRVVRRAPLPRPAGRGH